MTILKSVVLCLALANAGYFLWYHGIAKSRAMPVGPPLPTLKLASEAPLASAGAMATASAPTDAATAPQSGVGSEGAIAEGAGSEGSNPALAPATHCVTVGPFKDVSEASHAASTLRVGGYDPRQRVVDGEVWAGVWVYLPIAPHATADPMLAKLKAAGIDDALEMPGPGDGSVISLGLYSEQKRAQSRVAQAQALGFNPTLSDRKRNGNVYWIDIDLKPAEGLLNPADLQAEAGRISRLQIKACPGASTPAPAP